MDSYDQTSLCYNNPMEDGTEFSGILEVYVHEARNIHNICIYENQDVYAKFSLTYNPDETFSTRVINGGGRNPEFNEKLVIKINQFDAVLKCEMWMLSRAKSFMEDQLLGFSLVPISLILGKHQHLTQDFSLSSTDLFHSPAGTVKLSLSINTNLHPFNHTIVSPTTSSSSITSEVVLLDPKEYSRIEFPDMNVDNQNQQMVSEYFGLSGRANKSGFMLPGSFLCLGGACASNPVDNSGSSIQNSGLLDDRNPVDSPEKKNSFAGESVNFEKKDVKEESESDMQQQIVDMYMKSMQQFTESLANMKIPMNLEKIKAEDEQKVEMETKKKKKDGGRIFYGSRAFF
ncbi:hypothetical protein E3N88_11872 [Mikania micrantha]|uniref:C2 domain-containing protein n=1 Tax=Mikania micrantha TaxID=192012 RepID=A0A5N6P5W8_9ASTR|nr:hypothetical protein E3N88_11872 [Mikania micrantha]